MQTKTFALIKAMTELEPLKGIHPGKVIERKLKSLNLSQRRFADLIGIHNQSLNAIIKGKRRISVDTGLRIEKNFNLPEGFLLTLQVYYDIKSLKSSRQKKINIKPNVREILFWDTDFRQIDWIGQKEAVIRRVRERGSKREIEEIMRFYKALADI